MWRKVGEVIVKRIIYKCYCENCKRYMPDLEFNETIEKIDGYMFSTFSFRPSKCPFCKKEINQVIVKEW